MARRSPEADYSWPSLEERIVNIREMLADPSDLSRERILYLQTKLRKYNALTPDTLRDDLALLVRLSGWQAVMDALQEMAPKDSPTSLPNTRP